jgi:DoxX-like family
VDQRGHDQPDGAEQFGEAERLEPRGGKIVDPAAESLRELVTAIAACGLIVTMIGAMVTHARRGEYLNLAINVLLAIMAAVVAWGRFGPYSF